MHTCPSSGKFHGPSRGIYVDQSWKKVSGAISSAHAQSFHVCMHTPITMPFAHVIGEGVGNLQLEMSTNGLELVRNVVEELLGGDIVLALHSISRDGSVKV